MTCAIFCIYAPDSEGVPPTQPAVLAAQPICIRFTITPNTDTVGGEELRFPRAKADGPVNWTLSNNASAPAMLCPNMGFDKVCSLRSIPSAEVQVSGSDQSISLIGYFTNCPIALYF